MRIQEHIYQGFFGLKKKQDAGKYYHERVEKLKGFDYNLDIIIKAFQHLLVNHASKLTSYHEFLKKPSKETLDQVRNEIKKIEDLFDEDELDNNTEKKYTLKNLSIIEDLAKSEESLELGQMEKDSIIDLKELMNLLKSIEPVWQSQINFIRKNDKEILQDTENIKILSSILKEEGDILRMEESLLRKIDTKTGSLLRKTSLKEKDIQKTKDMDMNYRDIHYVR